MCALIVMCCMPDLFTKPTTGLLSALSCMSAWSDCLEESEDCDTPLSNVGIDLDTIPIVIC